jgi:hypothetical protein
MRYLTKNHFVVVIFLIEAILLTLNVKARYIGNREGMDIILYILTLLCFLSCIGILKDNRDAEAILFLWIWLGSLAIIAFISLLGLKIFMGLYSFRFWGYIIALTPVTAMSYIILLQSSLRNTRYRSNGTGT